MSKIERIEIVKQEDGTPIENVSSPVEGIIDLNSIQDYSIQVDYGPGGAGDLELQASIDGDSFSTITGSTQAMAGDPENTHIWNVVNSQFRFVKVVVPGTASAVTVRAAVQKVRKDY